jgi:hypothetical protein
MDSIEREILRQKMALRMGMFLESSNTVTCISSHYYDEPHACELCLVAHADELLVVKNRSGKILRVALPCLKEMVRFRVTEVDELPRWIDKLTELRAIAEKRKAEQEEARLAERKLLERKVIVRKRAPQTGA